MEIWAIINITPDSFYSGSRFLDTKQALTRVEKALQEGADKLDFGAESTRPFANPVSEEEEWKRLKPVLINLQKVFGTDWISTKVSVDTRHAETAKKAADLGVSIINDVSGLSDPKMPEVLQQYALQYVLMHIKGNPQTMQKNPEYQNVVLEIKNFFIEKTNHLLKFIKAENISWDPGIGFGKNDNHHKEIFLNIQDFRQRPHKLFFGISRKSFLGRLLNLDNPEERLNGTTIMHTY
ncbi:MAG: dihydropteroate synthase, partial [Candidatus Hydrogenedentota bacterium]